jgi:hypothetical protein
LCGTAIQYALTHVPIFETVAAVPQQAEQRNEQMSVCTNLTCVLSSIITVLDEGVIPYKDIVFETILKVFDMPESLVQV